MVISLTTALSHFDPLSPNPFDKAEAIKCISTLHRSLVSTFITKILKNKNNMNQNDYLLKVEAYLMLLGQTVGSTLCEVKKVAGKWT